MGLAEGVFCWCIRRGWGDDTRGRYAVRKDDETGSDHGHIMEYTSQNSK